MSRQTVRENLRSKEKTKRKQNWDDKSLSKLNKFPFNGLNGFPLNKLNGFSLNKSNLFPLNKLNWFFKKN